VRQQRLLLRMTTQPEGSAGPSLAVWLLIVALSAAALSVYAVTGVGFRRAELLTVMGIVGALLAMSGVYASLRPDPRLGRLFRGAAELFLLSIMVGALSYSGASLGLPLWDEALHSWDRAIGFDWRYWLAVVDGHPRLHLALVVAYHSMIPQLVLAMVALVTVRAERRLDVFLLAFGLAGAVTVAVAAVMPALSPVVHLGITAADHPNITLAVPLEFQEHALALREGRMRMVDLSRAQGLVTFPSFHTICAILLLLAFRHVPYLRWASLVMNGLMLLAIPVEGSHYLVDVFAGLAVALACWGLAGVILREERRRLPRPSKATAPAVVASSA
jgi:hypothetical protein